MRSEASLRGLGAIVVAVAAYGVIVNTALLFAMMAPLYILSGPVRGFLGIVTYSIEAFGRTYYSPALDMASFLSIIVITSSTLNVAAGLATTYLTLKRKEPHIIATEALMASSLTLLISLGTLSGIRRIITYELTRLTRSYGFTSTAGIVQIYSVHAQMLPAASILRGETYLFLTVPYTLAAVVSYMLVLRHAEKTEVLKEGEKDLKD